MRPIILKGHTRPVTSIKFNREGDLLFTAARDFEPCLWFSKDGERIGTYKGHTGAVYDMDVSWDSSKLVTASADNTVRVWDVMSGKQLHEIEHDKPTRVCTYSVGEKLLLTASGVPSKPSVLHIFKTDSFNDDSKQDGPLPIMSIAGDGVRTGHKSAINRGLWTNLNKEIISCGNDGAAIKWDSETGKQIDSVQVAKGGKAIAGAQLNHDGTMLICACKDMSAKLVDVKTLKVIKTFKSTRPINDAVLSPIHPVVLIGGGQEAMDVTTTATTQGRFEVEFFHAIFEDFIGDVKGHFGPVQALDMSSCGKMYASGSEDGYVRLHHLDPSFLDECSKLPGKDFWR